MFRSLAIVAIIFGSAGQCGLHAQTIDQSNVPDEIRSCLRTDRGLRLDGSINPFYLSGDYDGDGTTDFAINVTNQSDRGPGIHRILFCFGNKKRSVWSAGYKDSSVASPFTAWLLVPKESKLLSIHPKIKHDSLALLIGEEGGGLIYWNGQKFQWQQEE